MKREMLVITPIDSETWEVVQDFHIELEGYGKLVVPKGFRTDLASVPRIFWNILPPFGRYTQAAVIHDYLYRIQYDRKRSDQIFYNLMIEYGVKKFKAKLMYSMVRLFGGSHFN